MIKPKNTLDAIADDYDERLNAFSRNLILLGAITMMGVTLAAMIITDRKISNLNERLDSDIQIIEERLDSLEKAMSYHEEICNKWKQDLIGQLDSMKKEVTTSE